MSEQRTEQQETTVEEIPIPAEAPLPTVPPEVAHAERVLANGGFALQPWPKRGDYESREEYLARCERQHSIALLDCEGDRVANIPRDLLRRLMGLPEDWGRMILEQIGLAANASFEKGVRAGERAGRKAFLDTVHDLLGIDRLCESLAQIETALRDKAGRR